MNYKKKFIVDPGSRVRLDEIDPNDTGKQADDPDAKAAIAKDLERIAHLQFRLYAENRRSLLIVLQAPDAGGKDGTVQHVFRALNPQGAEVQAFKVPTPEEAAHDFLWRAHKAAPAHGHIAIFNRSHYEDILVPRVHRLVEKDVWSKRYDRINEFEKNLAAAGTHILKFFLHISNDEQLRRFEQRLDDPQKQWKISEADYAERQYWDDYEKAYEDIFAECSKERAPWFIVPANHKWFRNLVVARIVADTLDEMDLKIPTPTVDLEEIRRKYHVEQCHPGAARRAEPVEG